MDFAPRSPHTFVFADSSKISISSMAIFAGIPIAVGVAMYLNGQPLIDAVTMATLTTAFLGLLAWLGSSATVMEIDTRHRRIRLTSARIGEPEQTVLDVSFDQCDGAGVKRKPGDEGSPDTFHAYLQLKEGGTHRIPQDDTNANDERLAEETLARFIAVTKLRRIDGAPESAGLANLPEGIAAPARGAIVVFEDLEKPVELVLVVLVLGAFAAYFGPSHEPLHVRAAIIGSVLTGVLVMAAIAMLTKAIEIDTGARRIRLVRGWLGYRIWTVFDVAFLDCERVGVERVNYSTFRPFLQLRAGKRYTIPPQVRGYIHYWAPQQLADLFRLATGLPYRNDPPGSH